MLPKIMNQNYALKKGIVSLLTIAAVATALCAVSSAQAAYEAQDGDIIFHRSCSAQSGAIAEATNSHYTHVGIIFVENGRPMVYEASSTVRATPLQKFIQAGENGHYVIKRLKSSYKMDPRGLKREVMKMRGRRYDKYFKWCDSTIYCSELVWKAYQRGCGIELGSLRKLGDFNLSGDLASSTAKCRYGKNPPLDMKIIAPSDIYDSRLLTTVDSEGGKLSRITSFFGRLAGR